MRRTLVVLSLLGGLTLGPARPAAAQFDPTGPAKVAFLAKIAREMNQVYQAFRRANGAISAMKTRMEEMFPRQAFRDIESVFVSARSITSQMEQLSCNWRFRGPFADMRLNLLRGGSFCKGLLQQAYGAPLPGVDQGLEEFRQWQGSVRLNASRDAMVAADEWDELGAELGRAARDGLLSGDVNERHSMGLALRLSAIAEAGQLQVAAKDDAIASLELQAAQEDLDTYRREQWLRKSAGLSALLQAIENGETLAGQSPAASAIDGMARR